MNDQQPETTVEQIIEDELMASLKSAELRADEWRLRYRQERYLLDSLLDYLVERKEPFFLEDEEGRKKRIRNKFDLEEYGIDNGWI